MTTKRLKEQVRRNRDRFPEDFHIELTAIEKEEVVAKCDHLASLKYFSVFSASEVLAPKVPLGCLPMPGGPQTVYVPKQELGNEKNKEKK